MNSNIQTIAAFDFDGTLTYGDTLIPFLKFVSGNLNTNLKLSLLTPHFIKYLLGKESRQDLKENILTRFLKGYPIDEIRHLGSLFATQKLPELIKLDAIERFQWHLNQGHLCILISANLDIYLEAWGDSVGFHHVISSNCAVSPQGTLTGLLTGKTCRGSEKTSRLIDLAGPKDNFQLYAYGDSEGDRELLELADFAFYK